MDENNNKVLGDAFTWLFIGLLVSFIVSYITSIRSIANIVYGCLGGFGYILFIIAELIIAVLLSVRIRKMNPSTAKALYLAYAALTGISLNGILLVYTSESITYIFLATSIIFGVFAAIGKTTKLDLSKWGIYLLIALFGIIILEVINIFILNNTINIIVGIVGVLLFAAYTAYDINIALKNSYLVDCENKGIYCAFQLYLDFINLFIKLLRLFGKSRD